MYEAPIYNSLHIEALYIELVDSMERYTAPTKTTGVDVLTLQPTLKLFVDFWRVCSAQQSQSLPIGLEKDNVLPKFWNACTNCPRCVL